MEIAKFVLTCVGSFISVSAFFMGIWKSYSKKLDDKIEKIKAETSTTTDKLEKRVDLLEKTVTPNLGERLSNIEGTMKKMDNILTQIQNWFISNTPRS